MNTNKYDFSGWATKTDIKCSDGRIIRRDAFKDNDGKVVPLVWNHDHNDPLNVLGHALLENRENGVYAYGTFNDTEQGQNAKQLVQHGDITSLSIWANRLQQNGPDVLHGAIREVSLVLAGANPGAYIENIMSHGDYDDEQAIIYNDEDIVLSHSEGGEMNNNKDKTVKEIFDSMTEEQKEAIYLLMGMAASGEQPVAQHSDEQPNVNLKKIFDSMSKEQKDVAYFLIGKALEDKDDDDELEQSDFDYEEDYIDGNDYDYEGGQTIVKHNIFDNYEQADDTLSHAEMETIISDGKRMGSLKDGFLAHAQEYGIQNLEFLFPEAHELNGRPEFIKRDTGWVSKVMSGVHKTPFSKLKSTYADITGDEARAKGYMKGKLKKEEVFSLLKRTTQPTTIYKKQKMDRDDVIDITDFDVITWIKGEMRLMLDEEIARAILIGDGRLASDDDHIDTNCIRPVFSDADLYNIKATVAVKSAATEDEIAKEFIKQCIKARKEYKGSGNPTLYTTEDMLTSMLLLTDMNGRDLYESEAKLATKLRVKEIVTVEPMEGLTDASGNTVMAIMVNLNDYFVGADKGGAINMFDDFDIDFNQMKYLIETRCSGSLMKPYSAVTFSLSKTL